MIQEAVTKAPVPAPAGGRAPGSLSEIPLNHALADHPELSAYLASEGIVVPAGFAGTLAELPAYLDEEDRERLGLDGTLLCRRAEEFLAAAAALGGDTEELVGELTIVAGTDKEGNPEGFGEIAIRRGEVICIVGPTGSGKSRLLADIEWLAQGDTPTGRKVYLDGRASGAGERISGAYQRVAQLSQTMSFVMDVSVAEFLRLHGEARMVPDLDRVVAAVIEAANRLAGEPITAESELTALSGGQSRALMIADVAILSASPIVLIDEIENAGIDRQAALELLVGNEKIVLMATHDPLLALRAERRLVIANGAVVAERKTSIAELRELARLEEMDAELRRCRELIRSGKSVHSTMED